MNTPTHDPAPQNPPYRYVMVDIETLGTHPTTAPVLEIAAVPFSRVAAHPPFFYTHISYESNISAGRLPDLSTAVWWLQQHRRCPIDGTTPLLTALADFAKWATANTDAKTEWYCKGTNFDPLILDDLLDSQLIKRPWKYHQWRDVRTLQKFFNITPPNDQRTTHDPTDDCIQQIIIIQKCFAAL
jgi:hypothetical protein